MELKRQKPFVITIVGPESSGKTTLARQLSNLYGSPWVPEFAREYLEGLGRSYTADDLEVIARGQLESILKVTSGYPVFLPPSPLMVRPALTQSFATAHQPGVRANTRLKSSLDVVMEQYSFLTFSKVENVEPSGSVVIVDSGMLTLRMWARIKFGITIPLVEEALKEDVTSLYLLTRPLDNWEADPLREAPTLLDRAWIYNQYLRELSIIQVRQSILTKHV
jgi:nicotinamide riboside kinase